MERSIRSLKMRMNAYSVISKGMSDLHAIDIIYDRMTKINFKSPLSVGIGVASSLKDVISYFIQIDDSDMVPLLKKSGFSLVVIPAPLSYIFISALIKHVKPEEEFKLLNGKSLTIWNEYSISVKSKNNHVSFFSKDVDRFKSLLQECIWKDNNSLILATSSVEADYDEGEDEEYDDEVLDLIPFYPSSDYIGEPAIEDIVARNNDGTPRSVIIIGNTGSGKTTLSYLIAKKVGGKILKIPAREFHNLSLSYIITLLGFIKPSVLLMDDIQYILKKQKDYDYLLTTLESIHRDFTMVGTIMDDGTIDIEPAKFYYPGMRPGRIDEIIILESPSLEYRKKILKNYMHVNVTDEMMQLIASNASGLSGAYLKALAFKLDTQGVDNWQRIINVIRATSPLSMSIGEEESVTNDEASPFLAEMRRKELEGYNDKYDIGSTSKAKKRQRPSTNVQTTKRPTKKVFGKNAVELRR